MTTRNPLGSRPRLVLAGVAAAACVAVGLIVFTMRPADDVRPPAAAPASTTTPTPSASPAPTPASTPAPAPQPAAEVHAPAESTVAAVIGSEIAVADGPDAAPTRTLANPQPSGAPLVFLVVERQGDRLRVQLAERPNGRTGWISADAVELSTTTYALVVTTSTNTLDLYDHGERVASYPVATGTGGTPTPTGDFALTELLAPTNSGYGPYAYGLTAHSDVLTSFGGGPGQIGLHGTDDAASIGTDASHGCIRLSNADITRLAGLLPLGTPIQIR